MHTDVHNFLRERKKIVYYYTRFRFAHSFRNKCGNDSRKIRKILYAPLAETTSFFRRIFQLPPSLSSPPFRVFPLCVLQVAAALTNDAALADACRRLSTADTSRRNKFDNLSKESGSYGNSENCVGFSPGFRSRNFVLKSN